MYGRADIAGIPPWRSLECTRVTNYREESRVVCYSGNRVLTGTYNMADVRQRSYGVEIPPNVLPLALLGIMMSENRLAVVRSGQDGEFDRSLEACPDANWFELFAIMLSSFW